MIKDFLHEVYHRREWHSHWFFASAVLAPAAVGFVAVGMAPLQLLAVLMIGAWTIGSLIELAQLMGIVPGRFLFSDILATTFSGLYVWAGVALPAFWLLT